MHKAIQLDVLSQTPWDLGGYDLLVNINMIHITCREAMTGLMRHASQTLPEGGWLYLYGPF